MSHSTAASVLSPMQTIQLTQGKVAQVSDEDYERVTRYKWHAHKNHRTFYACRTIHKPMPGTIFLHRFILDAPDGIKIDHRDGDGLNCQRSNLRLATVADNTHNQRLSSKNTSGYKGVVWDKSHQKWRSEIFADGKLRFLGYFVLIEDAARAYDAAARAAFGEFAKTNF